MENKLVNWKHKWIDIVFSICFFHSRVVSKHNSQLVSYIPFSISNRMSNCQSKPEELLPNQLEQWEKKRKETR